MSIGYASWIIFLYLLLLMCFNGSGAREMIKENWIESTAHNHGNIKQIKMNNPKERITLSKDDDLQQNENVENDDIAKGINVLRLPSMDANDNDHNTIVDEQDDAAHIVMHTEHVHAANPSSHMDHMDPSLIVFFFMEDLKVGKRMPIYFPRRDPSSSPQFLPREEADSIPFSLEELPNLLQIFYLSQGSPQAKAMEDTLRECESKPIKGESKFCATSLESMLDFVRGTFGLKTQFKVLSTTHFTKSTTLLQNYTILEEPQEILFPNMVACHTMPYPYAIFYCHHQESENKVFKVLLGGENGDTASAVAVCHLDTSQWGHNHVSFRVLGIKPGSSPVCHFFPADNLVWIAMRSLN